mmetsp:Transcript_63445/g.112804  ORF Transcript_63445/g.112804 Transcript_63445/m.112804 type:complete len:500 (+) Transcript_63445:164-1663(+)
MQAVWQQVCTLCSPNAGQVESPKAEHASVLQRVETDMKEPVDPSEAVEKAKTPPDQLAEDEEEDKSDEDAIRRTQSMVQQKSKIEMHGFEPHSMADSFGLFDVNLVQDPDEPLNIQRYFRLCAATDLMVTLSCFSNWFKNGKRNTHAKVIPCLPAAHEERLSPKPTRIFFFDDNIDLAHCSPDDAGICNLRDIQSGQYVDFSEGKNGFCRHRAGRHTTLHASSEYKIVLVQANILDAMEDEDYFVKIISTHAEQDEKILVFMDINSTIVCVDTVTDKSMTEIILGTMFEFVEVKPEKPFELCWDDRKPVKIDKPMSFKAVAKKLSKDDPAYYHGFYCDDNCKLFFEQMEKHGAVSWSSQSDSEKLTWEKFNKTYEEYCTTLADGATERGITKSWFKCWEHLRKKKHSCCLNSFGIDARKVLCQTVDDENDVMHLTVNYKLWSDGDKEKFQKEYGFDVKQPRQRKKSRVEMDDDAAELMRTLVRRKSRISGTTPAGGYPQ